jgi:hypothetical protein
LQRRVTSSQAEKIQAAKEDNAELKKKLTEAQGLFRAKLAISQGSDYRIKI